MKEGHPMRDREVIEREMYRAREDLEANLSELKHVVAEKIDVKARARVAVEKGKLMAQDAVQRGKDAARDYAVRGKESAQRLVQRGEDRAYFTYLKAKDRPELVAAIAGGIIAIGVLAYVGHRKHWW
jgi:hypothetical protein